MASRQLVRADGRSENLGEGGEQWLGLSHVIGQVWLLNLSKLEGENCPPPQPHWYLRCWLLSTVQHTIISDQTHNILSRFFLSRSFSQNIKCKKWFLSCSPDSTTNYVIFVAFIRCCIFHQINLYLVKICKNEIWKSLSNSVNSLFMLCTNYGISIHK